MKHIFKKNTKRVYSSPSVWVYDREQLRRQRPVFYNNVRRRTEIHWDPRANPSNHLPFTYEGIRGRVNWYYRPKEIIRYGGNACVGIYCPGGAREIPGFQPHPYHSDWVLATCYTNDPKAAAEWAVELIMTAKGQ